MSLNLCYSLMRLGQDVRGVIEPLLQFDETGVGCKGCH